MQISEGALKRMVGDVDDQHRESMGSFHDDNRELIFGEGRRLGGQDRRGFLTKAALGGAALTVGSALVPVSRLLPRAMAAEVTDTDVATFAASVEYAAVAAYQMGAPLLSGAVLTAAETFAGHHQDHGDAFAGLVGGAKPAANAKLIEALTPTLQGLKTQEDVLAFAFQLENQAAATYLFALGVLTSPDAAELTASILPVESQHAVVLGSALGYAADTANYLPVEISVAAMGAEALTPDDYPVS